MNTEAAVMRRWLGAACILLSCQAAASQQEALLWLQKVAQSAQQVSYSGTFIYHNGERSETSRIVHLNIDGEQTERLEVLDGSPRVVLRHGDEVKCYLPERRLLIIEPHGARRHFPSLTPASVSALGANYVISKGGDSRIAGHESRMVRLTPRDDLRYGRDYWVDAGSGLLLKADTIDAAGRSLEMLAFTELSLGAPQQDEDLALAHADAGQWEVRRATLSSMSDDGPWRFAVQLPGFYRQAAMQRQVHSPADDGRTVRHWVYTDGLAALSVFISPITAAALPVAGDVHSLGALSVLNLVINDHQVVVMGDVPPAAVRRFAAGISAVQQ